MAEKINPHCPSTQSLDTKQQNIHITNTLSGKKPKVNTQS
jgi:hypothetical protein